MSMDCSLRNAGNPLAQLMSRSGRKTYSFGLSSQVKDKILLWISQQLGYSEDYVICWSWKISIKFGVQTGPLNVNELKTRSDPDVYILCFHKQEARK